MTKRFYKLYAAFGIVLASMTLPSLSHAALISGFDAINHDPAISNKTDYFTIYSSQNVGKRGWNTGLLVDYARRPLELGLPAGTRIFGVVDNTITGNFYATYGILDWFSVGMNIPIIFWNDFIPNAPPPFGVGPPAVGGPGFPGNQQISNLGDMRFELKFRIRNNEDKLVGIALLPFVTAPTGPSTVFAGNGAVTGGVKVIVDFNIIDRVKLALNVGYLARDDVTILNATMNDQLLLGLGLSVKIIERLMFIVEGHTEPVIEDLFQNEVQTPAEALGGFRIKVAEHWDINVGGGAGLTIGVGTPDFRGFLGFNYNWAPEPCAPCERPPQVEARQIQIDSVIHFEFDKANIRPQSYPILDDVASVIKANPGIKRVMIEGNTDSVGSDQYNQRLSERRAASVKTYLVNKGVNAGILDTVGYGESRPVATNDTAEGRAKNRRVEFKVVE
jgi:hypothetical protein